MNKRYYSVNYNYRKLDVFVDIDKLKTIRDDILKNSTKTLIRTSTKNIDAYKYMEELKYTKAGNTYYLEYLEINKPYIYYLLSYLIDSNIPLINVSSILKEIYRIDLSKEESDYIIKYYKECLSCIIVNLNNKEFSLLELRNRDSFTLKRKN